MPSSQRFTPFSELIDLNPRGRVGPTADLVPYVGMGDVSNNGQLMRIGERPAAQLAPGQTCFQDEDVLFAKITPCMENGKGAYVQGLDGRIAFGSTEFHVLRARPGVSSRFVYHWTRSRKFRRSAEVMMTGSAGQRRVPAAFFERYRIQHRTLSEQHHIAETLDAVNERIVLAQALLAKLATTRDGVLDHLLRYGVHTGRREKETLVGAIPEGWNVRGIGEICSVGSGGTPPRKEGAKFFTHGGVPWVKTLDLTEGEVSATSETLTPLAVKSARLRTYPPGSVLVAMYGGWEQIGRTGILSLPATVNQAISALEPGSDVDPVYLLCALQHGRPRWRRVAASSRKDPNITKDDVRKFLIPLPPLEEQAKIVEIRDALLSQLSWAAADLRKSCQLQESLLDDLLMGTL
ncbi:restriction endonuclease subunit S [Streptomyces roseoverticillatus]|uniref:restriction endonuclease subunit S n=1 Tax=Streptomyces roseoverticillatus TaxID=66429 RepID=UPI001F3E5B2C|nr:restriction endonuclease subunit S [Streptomyces roseoverticillatus]MCF3106355.1 restriction endonuclease subunit S [Streptomyces roseoverticillatus]